MRRRAARRRHGAAGFASAIVLLSALAWPGTARAGADRLDELVCSPYRIWQATALQFVQTQDPTVLDPFKTCELVKKNVEIYTLLRAAMQTSFRNNFAGIKFKGAAKDGSDGTLHTPEAALRVALVRAKDFLDQLKVPADVKELKKTAWVFAADEKFRGVLKPQDWLHPSATEIQGFLGGATQSLDLGDCAEEEWEAQVAWLRALYAEAQVHYYRVERKRGLLFDALRLLEQSVERSPTDRSLFMLGEARILSAPLLADDSKAWQAELSGLQFMWKSVLGRFAAASQPDLPPPEHGDDENCGWYPSLVERSSFLYLGVMLRNAVDVVARNAKHHERMVQLVPLLRAAGDHGGFVHMGDSVKIRPMDGDPDRRAALVERLDKAQLDGGGDEGGGGKKGKKKKKKKKKAAAGYLADYATEVGALARDMARATFVNDENLAAGVLAAAATRLHGRWYTMGQTESVDWNVNEQVFELADRLYGQGAKLVGVNNEVAREYVAQLAAEEEARKTEATPDESAASEGDKDEGAQKAKPDVTKPTSLQGIMAAIHASDGLARADIMARQAHMLYSYGLVFYYTPPAGTGLPIVLHTQAGDQTRFTQLARRAVATAKRAVELAHASRAPEEGAEPAALHEAEERCIRSRVHAVYGTSLLVLADKLSKDKRTPNPNREIAALESYLKVPFDFLEKAELSLRFARARYRMGGKHRERAKALAREGVRWFLDKARKPVLSWAVNEVTETRCPGLGEEGAPLEVDESKTCRICAWPIDLDQPVDPYTGAKAPTFHGKYLGRGHCDVLIGLLTVLRDTGDQHFIRTAINKVEGEDIPTETCLARLAEFR